MNHMLTHNKMVQPDKGKKTRKAGKKLKRKKCKTTEDFLSTNPNKSEKVTWNLLQGHCPLPYVESSRNTAFEGQASSPSSG
jgi:hypothetical protein